eukprot:TRINITY_DN459_c0_g2_i1.p2 TRINITY_DN459_c0_g2~~TRINITY_DN459_c0_g2_i1.p2  ORF type:complete len:164 (+),score=47.75 TRINITY_DN459_c0_g2_i1:450-941(+)
MKPADAQFAVYLHNAMELYVRSLDEAVATGALGMYAFELASISRVHTFPFSQSRKLLWSSIGLPDLFNAGGAIMSEAMEVIEGGRRVSADIVLHGSGLFLALCSLHPTQVTLQCGAAAVAVSSDYVHAVEGGHAGRLSVHLPSPYTGGDRVLRVTWVDQGFMS